MPLSLPLPLAPPAFAAPDEDEDDLALDADLAEAEADAELAAAAADRRGRWAADGMAYSPICGFGYVLLPAALPTANCELLLHARKCAGWCRS